MSVILGWKAAPEQYPPMELLDQVVAAEQAGFEALDVSDHFHPWSEEGQACFAWTWLGAAAVKTSKIILGTGVTSPIIRYHPAVVAQMAATLGVMAPGRSYLGMGTGEALNDYAPTGIWPGHSTRQRMMGEAIDLIRQLFTGEEVSYRGEFYTTEKARLYTRPEKPIPIYISSMVPNSASYAGEHGDGLFTVGGKELDLYRQILNSFEDGARRNRKDPAKMPRLIELNVAYTSDLDSAVQEMRRYWAGSFVPALFNQKIYTPKASAENGEVVGADTILKMCCFSPDPDEHVRFAMQFINLGFDQIYFHSAGPDPIGFLEQYGRDILPRIRAEVGSQGSRELQGSHDGGLKA